MRHDAELVRIERSSWTNWHRNVTRSIEAIYDIHNPEGRPDSEGLRRTTAKLQELIAEAQQAGLRIRAYGGGWSLSDAPTTDGWMLNTRFLNWFFPVSDASVSGDYAGHPEELLLVQCGRNISEINKYLEMQLGRSLRTSGASNGQTIVGAMSTSTHGSAIGEGPIPEHVVGMQLITGAGRVLWLERASYPVVSQSFIDKLGAGLIRDDQLFDALLVSFGSFGIIHCVMLETRELFLLEGYRQRMPYDEALQTAMDTLTFDDLNLPDDDDVPFFFQIVVNPHDVEGGVFVTTMYERPFSSGHVIDYEIEGGFGPGYELLGILSAITDAVPGSISTLVNTLAAFRLDSYDEPKVGTLGETFDFTTPRKDTAGAAIAVPAADASRAVAQLRRVHAQTGPTPVVFACRYVQPSRALLGFQQYAPTCVIDIDGVRSRRTRSFLRSMWQAFDEGDIPYSQHWGKMNNLNRSRVDTMYGPNVGLWLDARRRLLETPQSRWTFSSPFLERLGLAE